MLLQPFRNRIYLFNFKIRCSKEFPGNMSQGRAGLPSWCLRQIFIDCGWCFLIALSLVPQQTRTSDLTSETWSINSELRLGECVLQCRYFGKQTCDGSVFGASTFLSVKCGKWLTSLLLFSFEALGATQTTSCPGTFVSYGHCILDTPWDTVNVYGLWIRVFFPVTDHDEITLLPNALVFHWASQRKSGMVFRSNLFLSALRIAP